MRYLNIILFLAALTISMNCSMCDKGGGGTKPPTKEEQIQAYLVDGWLLFEQAEYDSAEYYFNEALALDNDVAESNAGKAWSLLMRDESSLTDVENLLNKAIDDDLIINDVQTALGIVNNFQKKYSSSANYIAQVLARSSSYVFQHKTDINYQDLLVIQAHSYFYNKQFDNAYEAILKLTTTYQFDPDDSSTWVVDGDVYPSYEGAISAVLSKVADQYKSF